MTMTERDNHLIVETRKSDLFPLSPLEEAFDAEIQQRFQTALLGLGLDEYNRLVRVSYPVAAGDSLVAFQYTRYDLLQADPYNVAKILLPHNPGLQNKLGEYPEMQDDIAGEDIHTTMRGEMDYEEDFIDALRKRIIERDGNLDSYRALSDPAYYTEGKPLTQWPESYEFVIFHPGNEIAQHVPPTQIERRGKLLGKRASIYGRLTVPASFDEHNFPRYKLAITYPQLYYETLRAYMQMQNIDPNDYKDEILNIDDYNHLGEQPHVEIPLHLSQPNSKQEIVGKIGQIVSGLTH